MKERAPAKVRETEVECERGSHRVRGTENKRVSERDITVSEGGNE